MEHSEKESGSAVLDIEIWDRALRGINAEAGYQEKAAEIAAVTGGRNEDWKPGI